MSIPLDEIPKPASDELWELWCLKIFAKVYALPQLQRYRTSGYPQQGIDLFGTRPDGTIVGIQCKLRSTEKALTVAEADDDLDQWIASGERLSHFAIACTHTSTKLHDWAIARSREGLQVNFYAWSDIVAILRTNPALRDELTDAKRINDARDELVYSRALIDLRDKMNLYALEKAATEIREPPLTAAYVSLELSEVTRRGEDVERVGGSYSIEQVMDAMQAALWTPTDDDGTLADAPSRGKSGGREDGRSAQRGNVLVLVGEAGRGKTTLLRYIAVQAAKARQAVLESSAALPEYRTAARALPWRERVPFYREVRLATDARPIEDLDHLACEILPSNSSGVERDWARAVVDAGRSLILLDGVDEVPDGPQRTALLANIRTLVQQNPRTLFVVSSRPGAAEGLRRALAAMTPREARVQALAGPKLHEFILHWHGAVTSVAESLYTGEGQFKRVREINDALKALPAKLDAARHIKSLMATPLLAALVCAYHLDHKALPDNQTKLMTSLAFCLIDYHDRQRPGMPPWPAYSRLDENEKLSILEAIAADMVRRLSPTIACDTDAPGGTDAFDQHIREFMKTAQWFQPPDLRDLRGGLTQRTGILHELQRGLLSFIHNEFRDFLAARHLMPQADKPEIYDAIVKTMRDRDWHGLIFFAVTADRDKQREGVADRLAAELLKIVNHPPNDLLRKTNKTAAEKKGADTYLSLRRVAFRLGGAKPPVTAAAYDALLKVRRSMLPPHSMEDAEIISELGTNAIPDLRYVPERDTATRAVCAYALRLIDHPDAHAARRGYAQYETDWDVLDELAQTIPVAAIAFIARGITEAAEDFEMPKEMHTRLVRQAAGLVPGASASPARALARRLAVLNIRADDEALGLFGAGASSGEPFAAIKVSIWGPAGSEAAIAALAAKDSGLRAMTELYLSGTQISNAGAAALAAKDSGLRALTTLYLNNTQITDAGAAALVSKDSGLRALTELYLNNTQITDAGAAALAAKDSGLRALTMLNLWKTRITDAGAAAIKKARPGLKIIH